MMSKVNMICDKCKHEFFCSPVDIKFTNVKIKNQELLLKYFVCPNCNTLYPIFLIRYKDMELFQKTNVYLSEYKNICNANLRSDLKLELIEKAKKKYKESRDKLSSAILDIRKNFSGFFTYDKQTKIIYYHEKSMEEKEK